MGINAAKDMQLKILAPGHTYREVLNPFNFGMVKSGEMFHSETEINAHKPIGTSTCFVHRFFFSLDVQRDQCFLKQ